MNITLIDTTKKTFKKFVPLALLRLSAKHKKAGDNVELLTAGKLPIRKPDIIYFSLIFLFDYQNDLRWILSYRKQYPKSKIVIGGLSPSLIRPKFEKHLKRKKIEIFEGRDPELEKLTPDFEITKYKYSYGFTSRGCPNKCKWCTVPKLEGKQNIVKNWKTQINTDLKEFHAFDNNLLATGSEHLENVLKYCYDNNIQFDCNQAMDAEILHKNKEIQAAFLKFPDIWIDLRFAWDSNRVNKSVPFVMDFLNDNNISGKVNIFYMLYDAYDKPEIVYNRVKTILNHKGKYAIKMMRFIDLESGVLLHKWGGVGDLWAFVIGLIPTGIISRGKYWSYMFKGDFQEFMNKAIYARNYKILKRGKDLHIPEFIKYCDKKI